MTQAPPRRLEMTPEQQSHADRSRPHSDAVHRLEIAVELQADQWSVRDELRRSNRHPVHGHDGYYHRRDADTFVREVRAGKIAVEPAVEPPPPAPATPPYQHPDDDGRGFYGIEEVAKLFGLDISQGDGPVQREIRRGRIPAVLTVHHRLSAKFPKGLIDDFLEGQRLLAERRAAAETAAGDLWCVGPDAEDDEPAEPAKPRQRKAK